MATNRKKLGKGKDIPKGTGRPQIPNLTLTDFIRDKEGSDKKIKDYEDALREWTKNQVEQAAGAPAGMDAPDLAALKEWSVDLKVYNRLYRSEIPFNFPDVWFKDEDVGTYSRISQVHQVINDGLPLIESGYKTLHVLATEEAFDKFTDWCLTSSGIKILGITQVTF